MNYIAFIICQNTQSQIFFSSFNNDLTAHIKTHTFTSLLMY